MTNPAGFANVRTHAEAHLRAIAADMRPNEKPAGQPEGKTRP